MCVRVRVRFGVVCDSSCGVGGGSARVWSIALQPLFFSCAVSAHSFWHLAVSCDACLIRAQPFSGGTCDRKGRKKGYLRGQRYDPQSKDGRRVANKGRETTQKGWAYRRQQRAPCFQPFINQQATHIRSQRGKKGAKVSVFSCL